MSFTVHKLHYLKYIAVLEDVNDVDTVDHHVNVVKLHFRLTQIRRLAFVDGIARSLVFI